MNADRIVIRGKEYRVEVNMRVIDAYLRGLGTDDLSEVGGGLPSDMLTLLYLSLVEGARLDGVELDITAEDLACMRRPEYESVMLAFGPVFKAQTSPQVPEESGKKKVQTAVNP